MKSILIVAALLSTIIASESSAQDTLAKTKTGVTVLTAPREDKKLNTAPRADTSSVTVIRGARVLTRDDTLAIRRAAVADTNEVAVVERIVADTAWARVSDRSKLIDIPSINGSTAGTAVVTKRVRLERRNGKWVRVSKK